ncbi:acid protease [Ceraceosorus guamensis]|uniref:Acid protease n=1 Tax=Ceraceosorus guamensis TaxID=1522189 RepID=A0A316VXL5_9BASI|nr:acid protease [Ceraceosorus guamensis]PWN42210.1 acid protease [Ceraceosorus guamensis]
MSSNRELEFLVEAKIGTPAQSFWLDPDSGSSDSWVKGKNCNGANCGNASRARYLRSKSSTGIKTPGDKTFTLQYGIGDVEGALIRDTFALGDINIANFTIGAATKLSKDFKTDKADGILGLGFRELASAHQKPFVDRVAEGNNLPQPVMSFAFGRHLSGTDAKSEMLIGDVNKSLFKGDLSYYDVQQSGYWEFKFDSFASGTAKGVQKGAGIVDTGTSLIAMPSQQAKAFWADVKGSKYDSASGTYTFPCDAKVDATLSLPNGKKFSLNEQDLNIGTDGAGSKRCVGAVLSSSTPGQTIFGLAALKSVYTVLDFGEKPRIGFAPINF